MSKGRPKRRDCRLRMNKIYSVINELENSLMKSEQIDRQILIAVRLDSIRGQALTKQLKEAQKENGQLLNMFQQENDANSTTRTNSITSCSTMSLVHLQYKYEELLASHNGLLKILELRSTETRQYQEENHKLREEIEMLRIKLQNYEEDITKLSDKIKDTRIRKNNKILRLKNERNTLRIVHNRLVNLLNKQCLERDAFLCETIKYTAESGKALLYQEIRKNNMLSYENFQLQQEIEYLQSVLNVKPAKSNESLSSRTKSIKY